jgi:hypothetical protein
MNRGQYGAAHYGRQYQWHRSNPGYGLVADSAGDLFGTTNSGGVNGVGTLYEIKHTSSGYATTATDLFDFTASNGVVPFGRLYIIFPPGVAGT